MNINKKKNERKFRMANNSLSLF